MTKPTRLLLGLAVAGLIVGFALNAGLVNTFNLDVLYTVLPLGAVFFGLFLIAKVLEKETQGYDEEHKVETKTAPQSAEHGSRGREAAHAPGTFPGETATRRITKAAKAA